MRFSLKLCLRRKLMVVMLGLLTLSLAAVWRVATTMARDSLVTLTRDTSAVSAQSLANAVALEVDDARADAWVASRLDLVAEVIDTGDPKTFVWYADELIRTKKRYAALWLLNADGQVVAANSRVPNAPTQNPLGASMAREAWYAEAHDDKSGRGTLVPATRPALLSAALEPDEFVFGFTYPVLDIVGERIGTLVALMSSKALDGMLAPSITRHGQSVDAFAALVDKDGRLVTLPPLARRAVVWGDVHQFARFEVSLGGAAEAWGWKVASLRRTELLERPVEALSVRLQTVFVLTLLVASLALVLLASALLRPIYKLTDAASGAIFGNAFAPIAVQGSDEISQLTRAFNDMMQAVQERESRLESARRELHDLFNKIPSAIFLVDAHGRIDPQYSAHCKTVFERDDITNMDVAELLHLRERTDEEAVSRMLFWLNNIFGADDLQWDMSEPDRMPEMQFRTAQNAAPKVLEMTYVPVYESEQIVRVIFIARDVTELRGLTKRALEAEQASRDTLQRVRDIARVDPSLFNAFMQETQAMLARSLALQAGLSETHDNVAALQEMNRHLHTVKGNARLFKLGQIQSAAHRCEDLSVALMRDGRVSNAQRQALGESLGQLTALVDEFGELFRQVTGDGAADRADRPPIATRAIERLERAVQALSQATDARPQVDAVVQATKALRERPIAEVLAPLREMTDDLARQLGKSVNALDIAAAEVSLDPQRVPRVLEILGHALRNAIDHGLETPDERVTAGKSTQRTVRVSCEQAVDHLLLEVADDGRGIDIQGVKTALVTKQLADEAAVANMSDEATIQSLFTPGFSTAKNVTDVSGRGVGLDAVAHMVRALGGSVELTSKVGADTTLRIVLPSK